MAGRPSLLTPTRIEIITTLVRRGNYIKVAAEAAGVSVATIYGWIERGELPEEQAQDTLYSQFLEALRKAEADSEQVLVASIEKAATGFIKKKRTTRRYRDPESGQMVEETSEEEAEVFDWRAASWMLQARHRQRWAQTPPPESEEGQVDEVKVLILPHAPSREAPKQLEQEPPDTMEDLLGG